MKLLFIHQNFPAQYKHLAPLLAADPANQVIALGDAANVGRCAGWPGVRLLGYESPRGAAAETHHYIRTLEKAVRRGQQVARVCLTLREQGFVPDVICVHPGWGEALYLKDVYPDSAVLGYFEFFYHGRGIDVGFDPEYPPALDDVFRVRTKNTVNLLSLQACDWGICPTHWQWGVHPAEYRNKISVIFDGVDTDVVKPNASTLVSLGEAGPTLTQADEVVTFVNRNLEPYRGWHSFIRAVPEIQRRRPKARIVVLGADEVSYGAPPSEGTYREKYLAEVRDRLDPARLHFLGQVPYAQFVALMQVSVVHVYLTYPFVLSWSMIEAMAAGALVVGSATPPVQEVVEDGFNGLLVDFFSPAAIADAVDRVLDHPDRMATLRQRARQTVVERYDLKRICLPKQVELIRSLVP